MMTTNRTYRPLGLAARALVALAVVGTVAACDSFFDVRTPGVIQAGDVDAVQDGPTFANSAFQTLATAVPRITVYGSWFTGETWVGDTFPTRNEFGRRDVTETNSSMLGDVWNPLVRAIAAGEQVVEILDGNPGTDLSIARGALTSGFGLTFMAEAFCEGTMRGAGGVPGSLMSQTQLLETAVSRFDRAIQSGSAAGGTQGSQLADAARVGKGRALLQLGRGAEAAQAVSGVASGFVFEIPYVDDAGNRGRLGNFVFSFSFRGSRANLVVAPFIREIGQDVTGDPSSPSGDPRIQWVDTGAFGQDAELPFFDQRKFNSWASSIRLASGLEARYIAAEGSGSSSQILELVNERRAVGGEDPYTGSNPLAELLRQRTIDFWLEGRRMADLQRHGNLLPGLTQPGGYYKSGVGDVGSQTCWPIPQAERVGNPNID